MSTFKKFLSESINDKGLFKAMFVVGFSGAGKSYTVKRLHGDVEPRVINIDRATEHFRKKADREIADLHDRAEEKKWKSIGPKAKRLTKVMISQYIINMLPLFVDGTMAEPEQILRRAKVLRDFGYDVGLIFLHVSPETAKRRVVDRVTPDNDRPVDPAHIDKQVAALPAAKELLNSKTFSFYREHNTDETEFSDKALEELFKKTQQFFNAPVKNPKGKAIIDDLETLEARLNHEKYLVPKHRSQKEVDLAADEWFPPSKRKD